LASREKKKLAPARVFFAGAGFHFLTK